MIRLTERAAWLLCSTALVIAAQLTTPASAAGTNATTVAEQTGLEEVLVTAQRRSESQEKTPVAVAVLSSDDLAKAAVVSEQDLRSATPGLSVRAGTNSNQLNYSLRGQSQDAFSGTRPGVLPYVNEVQIGGAGGSSAFYDLQSVQVLKGPQGTLFGRSATGGAVLFTTAKPTDEFGGYIDADGGNYSALKLESAINGPLMGDRVLGRLAGFFQSREGFQKNLFDGGREGKVKRAGLRGSLSVHFSDSVKNDLVIDYLHNDGESTIGVISGLLPYTGQGPPFIPIEFLYAGLSPPGFVPSATNPGPTLIGQGTFAGFVTPGLAPRLLPAGVTLATASPAQLTALQAAIHGITDPLYLAYFAQHGHDPQGIRGVLNDQSARGPFLVNSDASNFFRTDNLILTNATTFDLGADTQIKNILGYVNLRALNAFEADGTPYGISQNGVKGTGNAIVSKTTQLSEEIQLLGKASSGKLSYVAGLYFSDEKDARRQHSEFFDILFAAQVQLNHYDYKNTTYAGYVQGTYNINDSGLALTLGLRETSEKVGKVLQPTDVAYDRAIHGYTDATGVFTPASAYSNNQSETYQKLSWQVGLQDQISPNLLLYAVSRRAYKSGGFNGSVAPKIGFGEAAGDAYKAERVTDVEFGSKFQGRVGDMPARLNVALFSNWIANSQRTAFTLVAGSPATLTVNVPEGKTYGVELEGQIKPTDSLALGATANLTRPSFTSGKNIIVANGSSQVFDRVPDTPESSGTFFADFTIPVAGDKSVTLHGDVYHQAQSFTSPRSANNLGTELPSFTIADFRIAMDSSKSGWSAALNVKNAFDKVYYVGGLPVGEIYQINTLLPGEPRTYTFEIRQKF